MLPFKRHRPLIATSAALLAAGVFLGGSALGDQHAQPTPAALAARIATLQGQVSRLQAFARGVCVATNEARNHTDPYAPGANPAFSSDYLYFYVSDIATACIFAR